MGGGHPVKQPLNQMGCMELIRVDSRLERRLAAAGCPTRRRHEGNLFLDIAEVKRASSAPVTHSSSGSKPVSQQVGGWGAGFLNMFQKEKNVQFQPETGFMLHFILG